MGVITKKFCPKCSTEKLIEAFGKNKHKKLGVQDWCKECRKVYYRKYYKSRDRTKYKQWKLSHKIKRLIHVGEYLKEHPCVDCNEGDPIVLEFDHRDPKEKKGLISIMIYNSSLQDLNKEIAKCDVVCANCHRRRTAVQLGYYKMLEE